MDSMKITRQKRLSDGKTMVVIGLGKAVSLFSYANGDLLLPNPMYRLTSAAREQSHAR